MAIVPTAARQPTAETVACVFINSANAKLLGIEDTIGVLKLCANRIMGMAPEAAPEAKPFPPNSCFSDDLATVNGRLTSILEELQNLRQRLESFI